jgi:REP element-mobilizing transposase RayT
MLGYDYSTTGAYFLTLCTFSRRNLFWVDSYENLSQSGYPDCLNTNGRKVIDLIAIAAKGFSALSIHKFVVMPNHIHLLVEINSMNEEQKKIPDYVAVLKSLVSKEVHRRNGNIQVWQRSFHDHIIRNAEEMEKIALYIDMNAENWMEEKETPDYFRK